jgi:RHS repeat-associated protein
MQLPLGRRRGYSSAKLLAILGLLGILAAAFAACTRVVTHEPGSLGYDVANDHSGSADFSSSQDVPAYNGSWEGKAHLDSGATGTTYARGVIHTTVANGYIGNYGAAFYFPPGTLDGPSPKQNADLDIMGWNYAAGSEFGGIRIGSDHLARLIRGKPGQVDTIGSPFALQEGCWNVIDVHQVLSGGTAGEKKPWSYVYLDGKPAVSDIGTPNNFSHGATDMRYGLVSVATPDQNEGLDVYVDDSYVSTKGFTAPGTKACNPISGVQPSTIDRSAQTPLVDATSFLYSGDFPIQHGVSAGTIEDTRAAVLEGRVLNRAQQPLDGVRTMIVGHSELGYTTTRPDGKYYMAVNGGGDLRVRFEKDGYLPVERQLDVPWQDYTAVDDVVMTPLDDQPDTIDLSQGPAIQVAQGDPAKNSDGDATVLFKQGTTATMKLPDGSSQQISGPMTVRETEYTVGSNGPKAMPAELPPTSAYTYAVGVSVDQARAAGATEVDLDQPAISYTKNFVDFPVGNKVPAGIFDAAAGAWKAIPDTVSQGRVVKILSENGGIAQLDVTGSGNEATPSEYAALGITDPEREAMSGLFQTNDELWRVLLKQIAAGIDFNWGGRPDGATFASSSPLYLGDRQDKDCNGQGSIIECEDQVLGEHEDIMGSEFGLSYRSDRAKARAAAFKIEIPLDDGNLPQDLSAIELKVDVEGNRCSLQGGNCIERVNAPNIPSSYTYTWDGKDAFGRTLQGQHTATVSVGYVYSGAYADPVSFGSAEGVSISNSTLRQEVTLWRDFKGKVGTWDTKGEGLGGWTLDVHHAYDPSGEVLYKGDGTRQSTQDVNRIVKRVAGGGTNDTGADGIPAKEVSLSGVGIGGIAAAPDGGFYVSEPFRHVVRRVSPAGVISTFAGTGTAGTSGDHGQATLAKLYTPLGLDVGPDGSLFITDGHDLRIRRVYPDGTIDTVAGGASGENTGDGGDAKLAGLQEPLDVAAAPDGSFYISTYRALRKVDPGGIITTVFTSQQAQHGIYGIDVDPDGRPYVVDGPKIKRLNPDGTVTALAGGSDTGDAAEGVAAASALINPYDVAVQPDGSFYIAELPSNRKVKYVSPDGVLTTAAGNGQGLGQAGSYSADNTPARKAVIGYPIGVASAADGSVLILDNDGSRVLSLSPPLPGFSGTDIAIPSEDGSELYQFDRQGRHLSTRNALTGATLYSFGYTNGLLSQITEVTGDQDNITQIQHDANGNPTKIVSPFNQETLLSVDANGFLKDITNPKSEKTQFSYTHNTDCIRTSTTDGLLTTVTDPRNHTAKYCYDANGRLEQASDRASGYKTLDRSDIGGGYETTLQTKLGRRTKHKVARAANGEVTRTFTDPVDLESTLVIGHEDGVSVATAADGMKTTVSRAPDPRLGLEASTLQSMKTETPGGSEESTRTLQLQGTRQTNPPNQSDPFGFDTQTDTLSVNGRTYSTTYDRSSRRFTTTSPEGRQTTTDIDSQGRPTSEEVTGIQPLTIGYDSHGRLQDETTTDPVLGTRNWHYTYKTSGPATGLLDTITDPLSRTTAFQYDDAGRVTSETLPGGRVITYGYDANGNVTSVRTPPRFAGQTSLHTFSFSPVDLLQDYTPPDLGFSPRATTYDYNDDHDLERITRPDGTENGKPVDFHYSDAPARRLQSFGPPVAPGDPSEDTTLGYNAQSGNLSSITTPDNEEIQFSYDGSLPTRETFSGTIAVSASRTYDDDLRLASSSVNDAQTVDYLYWDDSLLKKAGDLTLTPDSDNGLLRATSMASGSTGHVTTSLSYNAFGELESQSASYGQSSLFSEQITQRDALGRIKQKVETTSQGSHTYDYTYEPTTGFLGTVVKDGITTVYGYDGNGNRLSKASGGVTLPGSYDDQDRLESYGGNTYAFTEAGELKAKTVGNDLTTYGYDALGNLDHVTLDADGTPTNISYVLDGFGRRIAKKVGGSLVQGFVYGSEALGPVAELDSQGNVRSRFVYATRSNVPDYMLRSGNKYRIITDDLGSPRMIVDTSSGQIAQELEYDEFGNVVRDTSPGFQPFGFAGGVYDRDTELIRFGARDYDPEAGRWVSKDPVGFASGAVNLFGYAFNDPVNLVDPSGLSVLDFLPDPIQNPVEDTLDATTKPFTYAYDVLTDQAQKALEYYADLTLDPCASFLERLAGTAGGLASSLATKQNAWKTALVLATAYIGGGALGGARYSVTRHPPHHPFKLVGKRPHIQILKYIKGKPGSGKRIQIPLP